MSKLELLKEKWYLATQQPIPRLRFTDDSHWREYRKQLELADEIIYYDSSKQSENDHKHGGKEE